MGGDEKIIGYAAQKFSGCIKLHQRMFAAVKDINVALRIDCYAGDFNEMFAGRKLEKVRNRFVMQFWNCLLAATRRNCSANENTSQDRQTTASSSPHIQIRSSN